MYKAIIDQPVFSIDELIVSEIRLKNDRVLRELYQMHFPMIRRMVVGNSGSEQEAKDIYQDAVIAFYERCQQPDFRLTCKISTYLYAVSRRLWLKRLGEKKWTPMAIHEIEPFEGMEAEMAKVDDHEVSVATMQEALSQLGEPCSSIILDFYFNKSSMEDIAGKFGYTNTDTAKNQKYKCLQRLKKLFFEKYKTSSHE